MIRELRAAVESEKTSFSKSYPDRALLGVSEDDETGKVFYWAAPFVDEPQVAIPMELSI